MLTWSQLRALGNSPLVRATVFIPLLGYVILLNKNLVQYAQLDPRFAVFAESFPWQLVLTYSGLTAIALGSILYTLWCPKLIKRFSEPAEYFASDFRYFWPRDQFQGKGQQITALLETLNSKEKEQLSLVVPKHLDLTQLAADERGAEAQLTYAIKTEWHIADFSKEPFRIVCAIAFFLGIGVTAINAVITFVRVAFSTLAAIGGA